MQIPLWLYFSSILTALFLPEMASFLLKRGGKSTVNAFWNSRSQIIKTSNFPLLSNFLPISSTYTNYKSFSTTTANMSAKGFLQTIAKRRTYYQLDKKSPISNERIAEIAEEVLKHTPSSFNSQSERIVFLAGQEHDQLWDIAKEVLKGIVPAKDYPKTEARLGGFQAAYGTFLFFVDRPSVQEFQNKFAIYADRFPEWATHSDGAHQIDLWSALEAEGLGCNLQHYNPLIDEKVKQQWGIPKEWELKAQLVLGTPKEGSGEPGQKAFKPIEERFLKFGV